MPVDVNNKRIYVDRENGKAIMLVDIMRGLGYYKRDKKGNRNLGMIIRNADIDKWSFRKPTPYKTDGERLTDAQIRLAKCALTPVSVTKILATSIGATASASYTKEEGLAEIKEWIYTRPAGGASQPFRVQDFDGYDGRTVAPDGGWRKITFEDEDVEKLRSVAMTVSDTGDYAGYNFKLTPMYNGSEYNGGLYQLFSMKIGNSASESIGSEAYLTSNVSIKDVASLDGNYRIALAVWIPNFGTSGGWGIFAGRMTIAQYFKENLGSQLKWLLPDFATNPYAFNFIASSVMDDNVKDYLAVPLLVKDLGNAKGEEQRFYLRAVSNVTQAYCMPSGQKEMEMFVDHVSAADVVGAQVVKFLPSGWYVAYRFSGSFTGSGSAQKQLNTLFIGSVRPITEDATAYLKATIRFVPATTGATEQTETIEQSFSISAGAQVTINGMTYNGVSVRQMPALTMKESDVETFTIL